ncbi:MAG: hypothetical protein PHH21_01200 [Candidatus Pacebacteria bacterium]|nr:hypothetical protein [Candidatus Paceibacterota bacterium]
MKKRLTFFLGGILIGLFAGIYLPFQFFHSDAAIAYYTAKPSLGHSWSEMECSEGLCIASDNNVGIGTDSPTEKLQIVGDLSVSGDVCNGSGNCLSALHGLTNACGTAARTYAYSEGGFSGTFCLIGTSTPESPSFPGVGASRTWTCPIVKSSAISCTATHLDSPYLIYSVHKEGDCTAMGGTVVATDGSGNQCRLWGSSCPTGWTRYKSYGAYTNPRTGLTYCGGGRPAGSCDGSWGNGSGNVLVYLVGSACCGGNCCGSCTTSFICFGDASYTASYYAIDVAGAGCFAGVWYCQGTSQVGCY